jgi:hypothetical protein
MHLHRLVRDGDPQSARQRLDERHGHLALVIPADAAALQRVTKITCLGTVLPIHERRAAGIAGFERSPQQCP